MNDFHVKSPDYKYKNFNKTIKYSYHQNPGKNLHSSLKKIQEDFLKLHISVNDELKNMISISNKS